MYVPNLERKFKDLVEGEVQQYTEKLVAHRSWHKDPDFGPHTTGFIAGLEQALVLFNLAKEKTLNDD